MLVSLALLVSAAMATPESVEQATRLHLLGFSAQAAELVLPEIDQDPAAAMVLGRIFFTHSQWALSEAAYHRVPRDSPLWFRSRLEASWAAYYLDPTHERAIARALLLYPEDPTDRELRYLMGILVLHCGKRSGRVGDLVDTMLRELVEDLEADLEHAPEPRASSLPALLEALYEDGLIDEQQREEAALRVSTLPEGWPGGWSHAPQFNAETGQKEWHLAPDQPSAPMPPAERVRAAEILQYEFTPSRMDAELGWEAKCGWASLDAPPRAGMLTEDGPVTRAILLTLTGEQDSGYGASGCSMHPDGGCRDPRAHRRRDREARRWLRSYREDLD
ncbi:MAG: hypothetical protein QGG40_06580 [Myxococcota bacterium]|nr:hypothetical protein [Myxococcota bacterium]